MVLHLLYYVLQSLLIICYCTLYLLIACESVCEFFDLPTTDDGNALYHLMEKSEVKIQ